MNSADSFASDYYDAREKFRLEAASAGGKLEAITNPEKGPGGKDLSADVAFFGAADAESIIVLISGTHGAEGFCGSGVQVDLLRRGELAKLPDGVGVLMIHALNPFGFAWLRRTNEDNIDLNRNWIDFDKPLPENPAYESIRELICPTEWTERSRSESRKAIADLAEKGGAKAVQLAVAGGQYSHSAGLFYGGKSASWSRKTQTELFAHYLHKARAVGIIDFHTGLGPWGYGDPIITAARGSAEHGRALSWYGCAITSPRGSDMPEAAGDGLSAAVSLLAHAQVTAIALEFGTLPLQVTLEALQADAWLHAFGELDSETGRDIKRQIRDSFYGDTPDWKGLVVGQGLRAWRSACAGIAADS